MTVATAPSRRLARNVGLLGGSQVATWSLTLVWTLFVPRRIGAAGMGELTAALSVTSIVGMILGLGIGTLLVKEIARDRGAAPRLVGAALLLAIASIPLAVAAIAAYLAVGHFSVTQVEVTWLVTAAMVVALMGRPLQSAFQGCERMEYLAYGEVLRKSGQTALGIVAVAAGFGVVSLGALGLAMGALVLLLNARWAPRLITVDWRVRLEDVRHLVVDSIPYVAAEAFYTLYVWLDSVLLSLLASSTVVGWYGVSNRLLGAVIVVPAILATAWLPQLSAAAAEGFETFRRRAATALEFSLVLSLPATAGTMLVAGPVVGLLYGQDFGGAAQVLVVLALFLPPTYLNTMLWPVLVASDRQAVWMRVMAAAVVVNVGLNLVAIPYFQAHHGNGAIGAALCLVATEVLQAAIGLRLLSGVTLAINRGRLGRAVLATAGMSAATLAVHPFGLAAQLIVGVTSFGALAVVLHVLTPEELRSLWTLLRPGRSRSAG